MRCKNDGSQMIPLGISYVCRHCDYKRIKPEKFWVPELRIKTSFPLDFDWSLFTATNATISGSTVSITSTFVQATLISPQITNLTRSATQLREYSKIKVDTATGVKNDGSIHLYASNDGGTTWTMFKDNDHTFNLNYGNEDACGGTKQTKYNDLRIKIDLKRTNASDTSPTISLLNIKYNRLPSTAWRTA